MSKRNKKKQRGPLTPRKDHIPVDGLMGSVGQFFGYTEEADAGKDSDPVCMATQVRESELPRLDGMNATAGQWIVSTGGHDSPGGPQLFGPFQNMEAAFDYGSQTFNAVSWRTT